MSSFLDLSFLGLGSKELIGQERAPGRQAGWCGEGGLCCVCASDSLHAGEHRAMSGGSASSESSII